MLFSVLNCDDPFHSDIKSRFFFHFLYRIFLNGNIHVYPAAGQ